MILQAEDVSASYDGIQVLRRVTLDLNQEEIVCLIGANGAGKSTLLRVLSGLLPPLQGKIVFHGKDITRIKASTLVKNGLCHIPEGRQIFGSLTVGQNLLLGGYAVKKARKDAEKLHSQVFDLFPILRKRLHQKAGTLSGGEQQMLAVGRGLMSLPKVLLLDEPSLGLAPMMVQAILDAIARLRSTGLSILLVEQNVIAALDTADRAYVMETGKIVASGLASDLKNSDDIKKSYLGM